MREYETVYITKPDLTEEQITKVNDRAKALIEKREGRLFYARNMGKRRLGYSIAKQTKGVYFCLDYAAKPETISELERSFRLSEDVIRFLTVVKAEEVDIEARTQEIAARGEDKPVQMSEESEQSETEEREDHEEENVETETE